MRGIPNNLRLILFGAISGAIWSMVPGFLLEFYFSSLQQTLVVCFAGMLTGALVSKALVSLTEGTSRHVFVLLDIATIPIGAFFFGFTLSVIQLATIPIAQFEFTFGDIASNPILTGLTYAAYSIGLLFILFPVPVGFILFPIAMIHSRLCRRYLIVHAPRKT